jgi:hypothetical protein
MNEIAMWFGYFMMVVHLIIGVVFVNGWILNLIYKRFKDQYAFMEMILRAVQEKGKDL